MKTSGIGGSAGGDVAAALLAVASRAAQLALKVRRGQVHCVVLSQQVKITLNDLDWCLSCHYLPSPGNTLFNSG